MWSFKFLFGVFAGNLIETDSDSQRETVKEETNKSDHGRKTVKIIGWERVSIYVIQVSQRSHEEKAKSL